MDAILDSTESQQTQLAKAMSAEGINIIPPKKEQEAKYAEFRAKMQEMRKRDRERIEALLTKQQLATFKRLATQWALRGALLSEFHRDASGIKVDSSLLIVSGPRPSRRRNCAGCMKTACG